MGSPPRPCWSVLVADAAAWCVVWPRTGNGAAPMGAMSSIYNQHELDLAAVKQESAQDDRMLQAVNEDTYLMWRVSARWHQDTERWRWVVAAVPHVDHAFTPIGIQKETKVLAVCNSLVATLLACGMAWDADLEIARGVRHSHIAAGPHRRIFCAPIINTLAADSGAEIERARMLSQDVIADVAPVLDVKEPLGDAVARGRRRRVPPV